MFIALAIGAALMVGAGIVELIFGVRAERRSLESIARPLTAARVDGPTPRPAML